MVCRPLPRCPRNKSHFPGASGIICVEDPQNTMRNRRAQPFAKHTEEIVALIEPDIEPNRMNSFGGGTFYGHVNVVFRTLDTAQDLGSQYCLRHHDLRWPYAVPMIGNLRIASQMDSDGRRNRGMNGVYGSEVEYYSAEVHRSEAARAMAATLKRVEDRLEAFREAEGEVATLGQYAVRVCRALGIKRMARLRHWERDKYAAEGYYRFLTLGEGQRYIDQQVDAFFEKYPEKVAA